MSSPNSPDALRGSPDDQQEDQAFRSARRSLTLFVIAVAAAAVGVIALLSGLIDEDSGDSSVAPVDPDAVTEVGPGAGEEVAPYADSRREQLTEVDGRRVAVVSFGSYLTEEDARDLVGDSVTVVSLLVAFPAEEPRVTESVPESRAMAVEEAESQLEEISGLVNTVEDPAFAEFYRAELIRYRKVITRADGDDVVFGAVVRGRAGDLRALAARAGVRLVDPADGAVLAEDARISGLRPEESITVGDPQFRP